MQTRVRLASRRELPESEKLKEAGWDEIKTATPDPKDRSEKTLADDGKRASDEPADVKVVADQSEPVTSKSKKADRTIRREEIIESDSPTAVKERPEVEQEETEEEDKTPESHNNNPFNSSTAVLAAFQLAELEQELGLDATLWNGDDKFARVASLEAEGTETLVQRISAFKNVKEAGLSKPVAKKRSSLPPLTGPVTKEASVTDTSIPVGDSVIFG